jgi:hypothetical protein
MGVRTRDIEAWVAGKRGVFFIDEIYPDVGAITRGDRKQVSWVIGILEKAGFLERSKKKRGKFRISDELVAKAKAKRREWDEVDESDKTDIVD